jgi:hypothetical protein
VAALLHCHHSLAWARGEKIASDLVTDAYSAIAPYLA